MGLNSCGPTTEICFKDVDWILKSENKTFVEPEIPCVHCESVGIKIYQKHYLQKSGIGFKFSLHVNLTNKC